MADKIFVREYLESLKEDGELDLIFGLLLDSMGFNIVTTPKDSRGMSQYGKDLIAVGRHEGILYRWYFEVKGYDDKDISAANFRKNDGIEMSLVEMKNTPFENSGIPEFNSLPIKCVVVHNGIVRANFRPTFEGYIKRSFNEGEFEDWDIHRLTDMFYSHLFGEYLMTDAVSLRLFKRILIFISEPDYTFADLDLLFNRIVDHYKEKPGERAFQKLLATINLLGVLIFHYGKEDGNLHASKEALKILVLKSWHFVILNDANSDSRLRRAFDKLLITQINCLDQYFEKTLKFVIAPKGLFAPSHISFEPLGQRLLGLQYLDDLIYFFYVTNSFITDSAALQEKHRAQKKLIKDLIDNNQDAYTSLIFDRQLIPIVHLFSFFLDYQTFDQTDYVFLSKYLVKCFDNMVIRHKVKGVWPHAGKDLEPLIEFEASGVRPAKYLDSSSLLISVLLELTAIFKKKELYAIMKNIFEGKISLQIAYPISEDPDFEARFFSENVDDSYYVEFIQDLPESCMEFREIISAKKRIPLEFKMHDFNLLSIKILAESFFRNDPEPNEWRRILDLVNIS